MPEEPVTFESSDGVALSGICREPAGKPRAGVVLAHGIMTHKEYGGFHPGLAAEFERHGFESLRFDFRGHGESGGKPEQMTIAGEVEDLAAAIQFLSHRHASPVGIVGTSLGAAIAVLYAARARQPPFALALLSAVLDFRRTIAKVQASLMGSAASLQSVPEAGAPSHQQDIDHIPHHV